MDLMTSLAAVPGAAPLLPYVAFAVAVCAALAVVLPHPAATSRSVYACVYTGVNFVALNFGHARNAEPASPAHAEPAAHN